MSNHSDFDSWGGGEANLLWTFQNTLTLESQKASEGVTKARVRV